MWALHNHPHRILQLSIGSRLPIEAQDALILGVGCLQIDSYINQWKLQKKIRKE